MESNWNYEKDLELVKQKVSTSSPSVKHKIQSLISDILAASLADNVERPRKPISTIVEYSTEPQGPSQSVILKPECLELDPPLILNTIRLMYQFKKDFQGTTKLLEAVRIKNSVAWKLFQTTSLAELQNLWHAFSVYLQKTVEPIFPESPLEVDLVLERIFGYLPTEELLNCRPVCRAWNERITQWEFPKRKECFVTLSSDEISRIIESDITSPFVFSTLDIYLAGIATDECNWFFTNYGPFVKVLTLHVEPRINSFDEDVPLQSSSLFEIFYNLRSIFQNVNQIQELRIFSIPESVLGQPFVLTPQELEIFPISTVRSLELCVTRDFPKSFSEGFFAMLRNVNSLCLRQFKPTNECQQVLDGIQKLKLDTFSLGYSDRSLRPNFWTSLETQSLKTFILEGYAYLQSEEDVASLERFLQSQSQTLETITNTNFLTRLNHTIRKTRFPIMQNLETLTFYSSNENCQFEPIVAHLVPKLRCTSFDFSKMSTYFGDGIFAAVQELSGSHNFVDLQVSEWKTLGSRFPNLKRLTVKVSYFVSWSAAPELFRCFPNLEYLDLDLRVRIEDKNDCASEVNLLLTGFTPEKQCILSQLLTTLKSKEELLQVEPDQPSLRDMKKLKELRLTLQSSRCDEIRIVIDNVCVQLGFMSMQALDQLSLFSDFTISEDGAGLLKNYHRNVLISPKP